MHRRATGFAIVAIALLAVVIVSGYVAPPLGGSAVRAVAPDPPGVGSCGDIEDAQLIVLDCSQPHSVEVTFSRWANDPDQIPRPTFASCAEKARDYVGSPPAQDVTAHRPGIWSLPLRYRPIVASGPGGTTIADWSWQVCLVAPIATDTSLGYRGRVAATTVSGPAAPELRACFTVDQPVLDVVPCAAPHFGEIIATQPISDPVDPTLATSSYEQTTSCMAAARALTGAADPTYGQQLRVAVFSDRGPRYRGPFSADTGVYYTSEGLSWLVCAIESTDSRTLANSVAGTGTGPLPFG